MNVTSVGPAVEPAVPGSTEQQLRQLAQKLEAVFLNQLLQAMRTTVPAGDGHQDSAGEQAFTSMLDDRLSVITAERMHDPLGEALYRQLNRANGGTE